MISRNAGNASTLKECEKISFNLRETHVNWRAFHKISGVEAGPIGKMLCKDIFHTGKISAVRMGCDIY